MDIELLRFANVLPHLLEDYMLEKSSSNIRIGGGEDSGGFVARIGRPRLGPGDGKQVFPLRHRW